jgi:hypothetical protein
MRSDGIRPSLRHVIIVRREEFNFAATSLSRSNGLMLFVEVGFTHESETTALPCVKWHEAFFSFPAENGNESLHKRLSMS